MELVRSFAALTRNDIPLAGGKGANLGEMARAGLPVPPGFVLLTPAYQAFVAAGALQPATQELAGAARPDDAASVDGASSAIRRLFDERDVPADIEAAVLEAYRQLGSPVVAVRSSATAEDLPGASFAGQQETYLNISGPAALMAAVKRCWSSLWTPRAISYRARQGIRPADVALAVVVQKLVYSDAAGVLFTANPINGRRDQMVIDGAFGLGESVVSGLVTPDHWVVEGQTGRVLEERIARKQVWTVRGADGSETRPLPAEMQEQPSLSQDQVAELSALGRQVAAHYGAPQDIEWAVEGGRLYLTQARPVTSLFPVPSAGPGFRAYVCLNILQGVIEPLTPAGIAVLEGVSRGSARLLYRIPVPDGQPAPAFKVAAGRIFLDATSPLRNRRLRRALLGFTGAIDRQMSEILRSLAETDPRLAVTESRLPFRPPIGLALKMVGRLILALVAPNAARRWALQAVAADVRAWEARIDGARDMASRVQILNELSALFLPKTVARLLPCAIVGIIARAAAEKRLPAGAVEPILRALPDNPTTEMDLELWRVSRTLKREGAVPTAAHPAVQAFLAKYGHRAVREIDAGMPRWSEDPTHVLEVLKTYLGHGAESDPERHFAESAAAAELAAARLAKGFVMKWLIKRVRALGGAREYPKFWFVQLPALARRIYRQAGEELLNRNRLDRIDDVYFLTPQELTSEADLRAVAAANRAAYTAELSRRAVPRVITTEGETLYGPPVSADGALPGIAASAGVYEGTVRVVFDPATARLEPGEVLVAPGTDPAWTPLFLTAGALVMEIGGPMSHGSVVAREYGIPAVVGVAGATQRLTTGTRVRVDGEKGQVIPL
ncbi:MAG TPA: PEP/pyruvate-binding domain-containing protein [Symbiobacteriaceae bacterium]|nr:PEP/pyruvate-binding domain-containing protein [Symbiobacteriaceae bacterium]